METSPIAKLRATVDVDIISSSPSQEKPMVSTPTSGYLMESQYAAALKRGLYVALCSRLCMYMLVYMFVAKLLVWPKTVS